MNISVVIHYLIAINLLTFFVYGHDKWKAQHPDPTAPPRRINPRRKKKRRSRKVKHARRRTPEATLLLLAALGGSVGALLAMHIFRHKTRHRKFTLGIPALLLVQIVVIVLILFKFH